MREGGTQEIQWNYRLSVRIVISSQMEESRHERSAFK